MQNKVPQDKEFCTLCTIQLSAQVLDSMQNPKSINELLRIGGKRLGALQARATARDIALDQVRAALTPELAEVVVSAGLEGGTLTVGVATAAWAARLRYAADALRAQMAITVGTEIRSVRIKVVPSRA